MSIFLAAVMVTAFTPAEGFTVTAEDISYSAALAADNEVSGEGHADQAATDEASVTIDGAALYYATLEEAFAAANGKTATITMLNDAECIKDSSGSPLNITGGSVTLNMNGKTLSGKGYGYYGIVNVSGGSLLVQGEGTIKVTDMGLRCSGGKLTVADTIFELVGNNKGYYSEAAVYNRGGTIIINGGKITGPGTLGQIQQFSGNTTINNVTAIESGDAEPYSLRYYNNGTLIINGGTFDKVSVASQNTGSISSVSQLLGDGCTYRHTDKTWATADELAAMEISNVTVEKIPLTIDPEAEISWYYNSAEHSLQMNAVPTTAGNEITYEWYNGDTKLDCTSDAYTIPKTMSAGTILTFVKQSVTAILCLMSLHLKSSS